VLRHSHFVFGNTEVSVRAKLRPPVEGGIGETPLLGCASPIVFALSGLRFILILVGFLMRKVEVVSCFFASCWCGGKWGGESERVSE
jgi:hypothetical protein